MEFSRARQLMRSAEIDALLVVGPENVSYATGAPIGPVHMFRRFGPYLALVPADSNGEPVAIVADSHERAVLEAGRISDVRTHPVWIEYMDITGQPGRDVRDQVASAAGEQPRQRPELFDLDLVLGLLQEVIAEGGLSRARIGVEFAQLPHADYHSIREALPDVEIVDSSHLFRQLRAIKSASEIERLREAVQITEAGIRAAVAVIRAGEAIQSVENAYRRGVIDKAAEMKLTAFRGSWDIISVGDRPWSTPVREHIAPGDIVKFDVGATVGGYTSDFGRTFVVGEPSPHQQTVYDALHAGFRAAVSTLAAGVPISDVFHNAQAAVRANGFPSYTRGHVGHSIGSDVGHEEWPWLSSYEHTVIEPQMVFAVEVPYYIDGVGGFMLEHNIVVGAEQNEILDTLHDTLDAIGL